MEQKTIILPEDLSARRRILEAELNIVIEAQVTYGLSEELKELLNSIGFKEGKAVVEWTFYGEYDDEGGTDYRPRDYYVSINGESIELEDDDYKDEDGEEVFLYDYLSDIIRGYGDDLYSQEIDSITVKLG